MFEKDLDILQNAKQAVIAYDMFKPYLDKEKNDVISQLKTQFRSNNHDLATYIGLVSTLVSLDNMENKLLKSIKAGNGPAKKVMPDV